MLISEGADVKSSHFLEASALMMAIEQGNLDIIKILLENGADANAKMQSGCSPLLLATIVS